jgi:hypothetical protein
MTKQFMQVSEVKDTLRKIGPLKPFKVTFLKKDGSFRTIFGQMEPFSGSSQEDFPSAVPVFEYSSDGFRSFKVDSVVSIEEVTK